MEACVERAIQNELVILRGQFQIAMSFRQHHRFGGVGRRLIGRLNRLDPLLLLLQPQFFEQVHI